MPLMRPDEILAIALCFYEVQRLKLSRVRSTSAAVMEWTPSAVLNGI
jgi:hypothetical protein